MARKTRARRIEATSRLVAGELAQRMKHPVVIAAVERIQAKATELYNENRTQHERLDAIQEEREKLFKSARENPPQDLRDRLEALKEEENRLLACGAHMPNPFDFEIKPYSEHDPFLKDRIICFENGVVVSVLPDHKAEERPRRWYWVLPDATLAGVKLLLPQRLLPMPQWVRLQVDLNAARVSRQAVVGDFEALLDHFHAMPPHPLDPIPTAQPRPRSVYKTGETVAMVSAYEAGTTFTEIGRRFGLDPTSVSKRIKKFYERIGVPMPRRGTRAIAAPPGGLCEPVGKPPGCPYRLCVGCPLASDPTVRETIENERRMGLGW